MHAQKGDWLEIDGVELGSPRRKGQIIDVLGELDHEHYQVRWEDDHASLFFPGSSAHVLHPKAKVS